ncbi:MAG TPA: glycine cleavage system aminomethyltransferase GcvT [Acidimicrobiales bacterium]|nr:glycine cleavage system aminomethyltransferase GcvT [Acidimicrobiales bacterium]
MTENEPTLRHSPLDSVHRALGAKMVPFGGWEMPLAYAGGTIAEHTSCRSDAVAFDVSHLGTVRVAGPESRDLLQSTLTNDLGKISPGRAQYTHLLDDADGSVLDDIIVWWLDEQTFDVMPNASNTARVRSAIGGRDVTPERAIIAVQGPNARKRLSTVAPDAAEVGRFRVTSFSWNGAECVAAGTGYTGEDGVECRVPAEAAPSFWETLLATGVLPAGLGARDTLRLEAALPLHGHELGPGITPLEAGLEWVVSWSKPEGFRGKEALERQKKAGITRKLGGLSTEGRQPPRTGAAVLKDGKQIGEVTSGNFSPVLGHGIALAFLPPDLAPGATAEIDLRGKRVPASVVSLPFVQKKG